MKCCSGWDWSKPSEGLEGAATEEVFCYTDLRHSENENGPGMEE